MKTLAEMERRYILHVLNKSNGDKVMTCKILAISNKGLYNKLHSYGYPIKQHRKSSLALK